ncbi:hypothetical protein CQA49_00875 [Helicobacter sp. MIT 00-7814]|uniref:conjugal transfer protein TraH n=1 Tax=unclassified Helicobacter TaxID=2593540 RepID=UPI000E1E4972|nr:MULTISPECIES: conjugal transfer protein TraH [unclassified Helicobacter]RDU55066.1 hypothetical protein CQA37_04465 [Helicobacter sp. MIT 99-10781]RDU56885.1 hypothetical protein CQA49_00875 [Helicobacter sp. MIT 00-7814]
MKRLIALVLSCSMITSSLHASFWDGLMKGWQNSPMGAVVDFADDGSAGSNFANVTNPQKGGSGAYYGGSVNFTFNVQGTQYAPWMDFQPPSMKFDCNGFSLDGGFIKFLGLEDIGQQLGSASGALVYGLLIGLVNSVPSIEHVFSKIKEMIAQIQNALRNACNFGKQLTKDTSFARGIGTVGKGVVEAAEGAEKYLVDEPTKWINNAKEKIMGKTGSATGASQEDASKEGVAAYELLFKTRGFAGLILTPELLPASLIENKGYVGISSKFVEGKTNAEKMYLLIRAIFGEYEVAPQNLDAFFVSINGAMGESIAEYVATGKVSNEKVAEVMAGESYAMTKGDNPTFGGNSFTYNYEYPAKEAKDLLKKLLRGDNGKIEVKTANVWYGAAKPSSGKRIFTLVIPGRLGQQNPKTTTIQWKGLEKESRDLIECYVNALVNGSAPNCTSTNGISLLVPGYPDILQTVVTLKLEGKHSSKKSAPEKGTKLAQAENIINRLAEANAYYFAEYFLSYLENLIVVGNSNNNSDKSQKIEMYENMKKTIDKYRQEIAKQIIDHSKVSDGLKKVIDDIIQTMQKDTARKVSK